MLRFTMTAQGSAKIDFAISGLVSKIKDWREVWPRVTDLIEARVMRGQFASRGLRGGTVWAGYKRTYSPDKLQGEPASLRTSQAVGRQIESFGSKRTAGARLGRIAARGELGSVDRLYNSLTSRTEDTVERYAPLSMAFGTSVPYAIFHQMGTRHMAARRIFDFQPEDNRAVASMMTAVARNAARRLGFRIAALGNERVGGAEALQIGATRLTEGGSLSDYL